jgi:hypothetical protein
MALKNQVANVYGVGISNVGSYQVAGRPFCMTGSVTKEDEITFPQVTKQITVMNRDSSNDIYVYFSASAPDANKFKIAQGVGNQFTFNVKCNKIYLSSSATPTYSLYASLTHIHKDRMFALTGSGISE